ncbi:hypothetical protein [Escherichia coli]|uniref:hypothetical protein n=1 Tax=Escherichia coli TaxID=562 RepID=UPI003D9C2442
MNERLKTHSKTQKKSADLVSNKLRIGVFQRYQMKCNRYQKNRRAIGAAANGVEVRGGTTTIGADSHISSAQGGGLVTSGSDAIINFTGTAAQRNSIFSGGSYGASAQTATAVVNMQNTDITVDRNGSLALGLWALSGGRITETVWLSPARQEPGEFMP